MDFDGNGPLIGTYRLPHELPLHGEVYKARPDAQAVVHAHPYSVLLCGLVGVEFRPVFGGYQPPTLRIALDGVPVYDRVTQTITNRELALEMLDAMGDRNPRPAQGPRGRDHRQERPGSHPARPQVSNTLRRSRGNWCSPAGTATYLTSRTSTAAATALSARGAPAESGVVEVAEGGEWLRHIRDLEAGAGLPSTASGDE